MTTSAKPATKAAKAKPRTTKVTTAKPTMAKSATTKPTKEDIIKLEKAYWDAMKAKDGDKSAELSAAVSIVIGAKGVMTIPKAKMGKMTEEGKWTLESYKFDNIEFAAPTPDVAIIAYTVKQKITMDGKKQAISSAESSTWIRGAKGWECHAHSESMLQG